MNFYADSKSIKFTKFDVNHQKRQAWESLLNFIKVGKHPQKVKYLMKNHTIRFSIWENHTKLQRFQAPIYTNVKFCIFGWKKNHRCMFTCFFVVFFSLFFFFFFKGWLYQINGTRRLGEGSFEQKSKALLPFSKRPKRLKRNKPPSHASFFSNDIQSKF